MTETPCDRCDGVMTDGLRYEPVRTVPVLICWDCGSEDPPFVQQQPARSRLRTCTWCFVRFPIVPTNQSQTTCSPACAGHQAANAAERRSTGRALRRKAS